MKGIHLKIILNEGYRHIININKTNVGYNNLPLQPYVKETECQHLQDTMRRHVS